LVVNAADAEWDVHLTTTNDYKGAIKSEWKDLAVLEQVLVKQHPRFIWRCVLRMGQGPALEFLADGTDMSRSLPIYYMIWHDLSFKKHLGAILQEPKLESILSRVLSPRLLSFLREWAK